MERYPHQPPAVQEHDPHPEREEATQRSLGGQAIADQYHYRGCELGLLPPEREGSVPKKSRLALVSRRSGEVMERVVQRKKRDEQLRKQGYSMIIDTGAAVIGTKAHENLND